MRTYRLRAEPQTCLLSIGGKHVLVTTTVDPDAILRAARQAAKDGDTVISRNALVTIEAVPE